jgi:polyphosphate kinase
MEPFLRMIREAANDPAVISIKISIYRVAQKARLIEYLCAAAENGKDVTALIELRARFDEQNNINWSERLEESGCHLIYGFDEYKIHAKICLITRKEKNEIQYITQVGTGNYNEVTAELYTDLCLITSDKYIGADAANFFKDMAIANLNGVYSRLLIAPNSFKNNILALIDEQVKLREDGRIIFKINSLTDFDVIKKLAEASQAGVSVTLIVRGICCLLPGIAGQTENIKVRSIVGRFLEHSRVYSFGVVGSGQKIYISSGDMMTRNTNRRVEISCPILDDKIKRRINDMLDVMLSDNVKARALRGDGFYEKVNGADVPVNSQEIFMQEAVKQASLSDTGNIVSPGPIRSGIKRLLEAVIERL